MYLYKLVNIIVIYLDFAIQRETIHVPWLSKARQRSKVDTAAGTAITECSGELATLQCSGSTGAAS